MKVRFAIVGTGRISDWILKGALLEERFVPEAVCSRSLEKAREFAERYGIAKVYDDIETMAADPNIDAVYIGTPNHTHKDIAIQCMRKGKHVLCEKPLAASAEEAEHMAQVAKECGVLLMEAMISSLSPNFRKLMETLPQLGRIRSYSASFCQYSTKYDKLVQALSKGEDDVTIPSSFNPDAAGGALMDIGTYTIYPMVTLFGAPQRIQSSLMYLPLPHGKKVDVGGSAVFTYPGMEASVRFSKVADSFLPSEICGERGNIVLDQIHICRELKFVPHGAPSAGRGARSEAADISCPPQKDEYSCEFSEFIDILEHGRRESSINTLKTSIEVLRIMDEIRNTL